MKPGAFFRSLSGIIEPKRMITDSVSLSQYGKNVCGIDNKLKGLIFPESPDELKAIVHSANQYRVPLYPISSGKNWGLGAKIPSDENCVLVDLKGLNRIIACDDLGGTIEVEAGVTQDQVAKFLKKTKSRFSLNVTGSSRYSSIIGNAMERGVAHYGGRVAELMSMRILLGNGEMVNVGGSVLPASKARNSYGCALGPDLRGLFFQSSFGIVISAVVRLRPVRESVGVISFQPRDGISFSDFIDALSEANHAGLIPGNLHISNRSRRLSVAAPLYARTHRISLAKATSILRKSFQSDWSATASYSGPRGVTRAILKELRRAHGERIDFDLLFENDFNRKARRSKLLSAMRGTYSHALGQPSSDSILSLGFESGKLIDENPTRSEVGTLFVAPIVPFHPKPISIARRIVERIFRSKGFTPFMTFNLLEERNLEGVINLTFRKNDKMEGLRAHECIDETFRELFEHGLFPQRLSVFQARKFSGYDPDHMKMLEKLGNAFDPEGIIAPGRYGMKKGNIS